MKTQYDIQDDIDSLIIGLNNLPPVLTPKDKKYKNKSLSKINVLRKLKTYIETNPREEFIQSELSSLNNNLIRFNETYSNFLKDNPKMVGNLKAKGKYETMFNVRETKERIENLKYILTNR